MEDEPLLQSRRNVQRESVTSEDVPKRNVESIDLIANHNMKTDFTWKLALSMAACTLGSSFQFGYNTGIVNAPEKVLKQFYNETYYNRTGNIMSCDGEHPSHCNKLLFLWSITVALYAIGGMIGGFSAGNLANRWGRKKTLMLNNILMIVAVAVEFSSKYLKAYEVLIVGRLLIGINAGINTGIAPMYLSEISPISLRGLCGTFNQLCITLGVLVSTIMGLDSVLGTPDLWQYAFAFPLVLVVWQLVTLSFCPESPRFLFITKHSQEEAHKVLVWLRDSENVDDEISEMIQEREAAKDMKKFTIGDLFNSEELRKPLFICIVMHLSQQLSGINAVIYYSTSIFESAGLSEKGAQFATLATGAVNSSMTFVSALIMDKLGRRTLHLTGLGGMFIFSYILTLGQIYEQYDKHTWLGIICVVAVIGYIISFATGPGAIPWFFTAELFSQGPRSAAVSIGVVVNWAANAIVGITYPFLEKKVKAYSFVPFVVLLAIFWTYTLLKVPETKGRRIEEITAMFQTKRHVRYRQIRRNDSGDETE